MPDQQRQEYQQAMSGYRGAQQRAAGIVSQAKAVLSDRLKELPTLEEMDRADEELQICRSLVFNAWALLNPEERAQEESLPFPVSQLGADCPEIGRPA